MKETIKTMAGIVVGATLTLGGQALSADEVITIGDDGKVLITQDKTVTVFSGTLDQVNAKISAFDRHIARIQKEIDKLNIEKSVYVDLKVKIENKLK